MVPKGIFSAKVIGKENLQLVKVRNSSAFLSLDRKSLGIQYSWSSFMPSGWIVLPILLGPFIDAA